MDHAVRIFKISLHVGRVILLNLTIAALSVILLHANFLFHRYTQLSNVVYDWVDERYRRAFVAFEILND
jgi:hypothetical protein